MALAVAAPWTLRFVLWRWEQNPILRGRLLAEEVGCMSCHRPFAGTEIPNLGSRWGTVPAFQSGNPFMYDATERGTIEEYIRLGAPRAWLDDPATAERLNTQRLRMPAYEDRLSDPEIDDLVAYASALEGVGLPRGATVEAGRALARRYGCLSCHGVEGSGGLPNPGSMGGFVPGFAGRNFSDLVRDEDEFREWILTGTLSRLESRALVRYFWRRQEIAMPAYRDVLSDSEIGELWEWVGALREAASAE